MGGKGDGKKKSKKGGQQSRAQQQQQAAARRSFTAPGSPRTSGKVEDRALPPMTAALAGQAARPVAGPHPPTGLPAPQVIPESGPFQAAAPKVVHYVDVAVVRIQDWLGRTPDLKFRRGGSVLLSESTSREAWDGKLPQGVRWKLTA